MVLILKMNYPKVFIIVLNYNGKDVLSKCLNSVYRLDYPNLEVVVVDNNSTDGSFEEAQSGFNKFHFINFPSFFILFALKIIFFNSNYSQLLVTKLPLIEQ